MLADTVNPYVYENEEFLFSVGIEPELFISCIACSYEANYNNHRENAWQLLELQTGWDGRWPTQPELTQAECIFDVYLEQFRHQLFVQRFPILMFEIIDTVVHPESIQFVLMTNSSKIIQSATVPPMPPLV